MTDWSHIGSTLRGTRESRSLSVHDVSHETRIPVKALHELEEGDFSGFASPAYAKSFLGQYCQFLDLDSDDWLDDFEVSAAKLDFDALAVLDYDDPEDAPEPPASHRAPAPAAPAPRQASGSPALQPVAVFLATAMLLAAGIYGFMRLNDRLSEVAGENPDSPAAEAATPAPGRAQTPPPAPSPPLAANDTSPGGRPSSPTSPEDLGQPLVIEAQPPRAVIVEE
jgi:cytoskeletal protein RodZ